MKLEKANHTAFNIDSLKFVYTIAIHWLRIFLNLTKQQHWLISTTLFSEFGVVFSTLNSLSLSHTIWCGKYVAIFFELLSKYVISWTFHAWNKSCYLFPRYHCHFCFCRPGSSWSRSWHSCFGSWTTGKGRSQILKWPYLA